tara:strand:- start:2199 stop:2750 length:552 start_codon:yes stop_codon:yes gene_type:complete
MKSSNRNLKLRLIYLPIISIVALSGCGVYDDLISDEDLSEKSIDEVDYSKRNTLFGRGGLDTLFSGTGSNQNEGGALGVNSYLWRASLDTIAFMPVSSADPFGGVIITDWYTPKEAPSERFKLNVYILDKALRADGIRVAAFRQIQDQLGNWKDAGIPTEAGTKIEDAILVRARQLRNQSKRQ